MYPARAPATTIASARAICILFFTSSLIRQVSYPVNLCVPCVKDFREASNRSSYGKLNKVAEEEPNAHCHRRRRPERAETLLRPRDPRQHCRSGTHLQGEFRTRLRRNPGTSQARRLGRYDPNRAGLPRTRQHQRSGKIMLGTIARHPQLQRQCCVDSALDPRTPEPRSQKATRNRVKSEGRIQNAEVNRSEERR